MKINIPKDVSFILEKLNKANYESYVVGGCVRDSILGRMPSDWDICTNAKPEEILEVFKGIKTIPTGIKHGTVTILLNNIGYEVTAYRVDGEYTDNRRPDNVVFTDSLEEDLSRRDFTINAMAYNEERGLVDPFNGMLGISKRDIQCVGKASERFKEDGLRMLRAIRFATQLDFNIENHTGCAIYDNSDLLKNISKERIRDEFNKILVSDNASKGINLLVNFTLIKYIVPELIPCVRFEQCNPNHNKSVFGHTMTVLDNIDAKLELRLAALMHDIGKPNTFTKDDEGTGHFYSHHKASSRICREVMQRLRYSSKEIEYVSELVYHHMTRYEKLRTPSVKKFIRKVGEDKLEDLFKLFIADRVSSKPPFTFDEIYKLKFECERILSEEEPLSIKDLAINGHDLMDMGIPEGIKVGEVLNELLDMVLCNPELNTKDILVSIVEVDIIK